MDSVQIRERLHRPRRFLVSLSLSLIGWWLLGAQAKAEVEQFGFGLKFEHSERVLLCLLLVWAWSVLRYLQFANELRAELHRDFMDDVSAEERRLVLKVARKHARRDADAGTLGGSGYADIEILQMQSDPYLVSGSTIPPWSVPTPNGGRYFEHLGLRLRWRNTKTGEIEMLSTNYGVTLSKWQYLRLVLRSYWSATVRLPAFGDHVAPLILAVLAFASCVATICN
jgi:hypothetical protein